MPTLSIAEFPGEQLHGYAATPRLPPLAEQAVEFTGDAASVSEPFNGGTTVIRVLADAPCTIQVGQEPEAAPTSLRLAVGIVEFFGVPPAARLSVLKIAGPPVGEATPKKVSKSGRRNKPVDRRPKSRRARLR